MELLYKRPDGTYIIRHNGYPYHVVEGDEQFWQEAVTLAAQMGDALQFEPPPEPLVLPPMTKINKADIWRRATQAEAELMAAALANAPAQLRELYAAASYIDINDPEFPALRAGIAAAIGEERADEVLAPNM